MAVDPGPTQSAYAIIRGTDCRPLAVGKVPNHDLLTDIAAWADRRCAIEMVSNYGVQPSADLLQTCVWIGRFVERCYRREYIEPTLVLRPNVKLHHTGHRQSKDKDVTAALVERFTPGEPKFGKGTKDAPGWFYGFKADVWQAYALAVYISDTIPK
jgi:hypothetical protein